jgi:hypothetical protein
VDVAAESLELLDSPARGGLVTSLPDEAPAGSPGGGFVRHSSAGSFWLRITSRGSGVPTTSWSLPS